MSVNQVFVRRMRLYYVLTKVKVALKLILKYFIENHEEGGRTKFELIGDVTDGWWKT
ncbi:unnamed protein product [Sphenostylis stenocarpa]|uniref:Uncharacterized protein n=1 Tax=Sphenostylis stenocarpa TaxID=92480 RepID=A0AA86W262_9FABA|nr:unnamed protein product [Sphenostylis stenocarpa]